MVRPLLIAAIVFGVFLLLGLSYSNNRSNLAEAVEMENMIANISFADITPQTKDKIVGFYFVEDGDVTKARSLLGSDQSAKVFI